MKCPHCQKNESRVIESRDVADGESIRRRRQCTGCDYRYTTYERIERPHLVVVKNDGTRQLFNRDKLLAGLMRACEKTTVTTIQLEELVARLEKELYESGDSEVSSQQVGALVMDELADLDDVAYVRFASVYRRFTDIKSFERELSRMKHRPKERSNR